MSDRQRADALAILHAALAAADSHGVIARNLTLEPDALLVAGTHLPLAAQSRVVVIGAGKASARMASAASNILGDRCDGGVVSVKDGHTEDVEGIAIREAGHPLPDERSLANGRAILAAVQGLTSKDVVLCLISGGGSALMEILGAGLTLENLRGVTRALMHAGADIVELNCVRKHVSLLKGGQLARWAQPARVCTLILSDVVGDDLSTIASGPTVPDPTTFADAIRILEHYNLTTTPDVLPVYDYLKARVAEQAEENPSTNDVLFQRVTNVVVGSNRVALEAAARQAESLGYRAEILTAYLQGEAREVGKLLAGIARERGTPDSRANVSLSGGETTVTVRGHGRGGRNQEVALAAAIVLDSVPDVTMLCAATDGGDGSSAAAGAMVDGTTRARALALDVQPLAFLAHNNSDEFFQRLDNQVVTGPTLTNVNDLVIALCHA